MPAIAMGLIWGGYTAGLYGYCLVRGYDISFRQLVSPTAWYSGAWPPPLIADVTIILPRGAAAGATAARHRRARKRGGNVTAV
jgi:hypothetical protein